MLRKVLVLAAIIISAASVCHANLITNGGFESDYPTTAPPSFTTLNAGNTSLTGWTIGGSGIDWIGTLWQSNSGNHSLDINALNTGSISQSFATVPGSPYEVHFAMAGNTGANPGTKHLRVSAGGVYQDFTFDTAGKSYSNMGWINEQFNFTATGSTSTLTFAGLDNNSNAGPALDDVWVILDPPAAVPEPSSMLLLGFGLVGVVALRKVK